LDENFDQNKARNIKYKTNHFLLKERAKLSNNYQHSQQYNERFYTQTIRFLSNIKHQMEVSYLRRDQPLTDIDLILSLTAAAA